jgi:hypothetical protein
MIGILSKCKTYFYDRPRGSARTLSLGQGLMRNRDCETAASVVSLLPMVRTAGSGERLAMCPVCDHKYAIEKEGSP